MKVSLKGISLQRLHGLHLIESYAMNTATKYFLFEMFIVYPVLLFILMLLCVLFVASLPFLAYNQLKKRWNGSYETRKDLEDSRKGSHRD